MVWGNYEFMDDNVDNNQPEDEETANKMDKQRRLMEQQQAQRLAELEQQPDSEEERAKKKKFNPFAKVMDYLSLGKKKKKATKSRTVDDELEASIEHVQDDNNDDLDLLTDATHSHNDQKSLFMSKGTLRRTKRYDDSSDVISLFKTRRTQKNELNDSDDNSKAFKLGTQYDQDLLAISE